MSEYTYSATGGVQVGGWAKASSPHGVELFFDSAPYSPSPYINLDTGGSTANVRFIGISSKTVIAAPTIGNKSAFIGAKPVVSNKYGHPRAYSNSYTGLGGVVTGGHADSLKSYPITVFPPSLPFTINLLAVSRVFYSGGYVAPPAESLVFDFRINYTPPPAITVNFEFGVSGLGRVIGVSLGSHSDAFGDAEFTQVERRIACTGIERRNRFGGTHVTGDMVAQNIQTMSFGGEVFGYVSRPQGNGEVYSYFPEFKPTGIDSAEYGIPAVTYLHRELFLEGFLDSRFGLESDVSFDIRTLFPAGISPPEMADHEIIGARSLYPEGIQSRGDLNQSWLHKVDYDTQRINYIGFPSLEISEPALYSEYPQCFPFSIPMLTGFGSAEASNRTQYIITNDIAETQLPPIWGEVFPKFSPYVYNKNRVIGAQSFGGYTITRWTLVENDAQGISAIGFDASGYSGIGGAAVTFKIRNVLPEWGEGESFSKYNYVRNEKTSIFASGIDDEETGEPHIYSDMQFVSPYEMPSVSAFSSPFVSRSVRTVSQKTIIDHSAYISFNTHVSHEHRTVSPSSVGIPDSSFGRAHAFIYDTELKIVSMLVSNKFGYNTSVRNRTPQIYPWAYDMALWGKPLVGNKYRTITAEGMEQSYYGKPRVSDKIQTVKPTGFYRGKIGKTEIIMYLPPLATQYIMPNYIGSDVNFGAPQLNVISPYGKDQAGYGHPSLAGDTIIPKGIPPRDYGERWGRPSFSGDQWIYPSVFQAGNEEPLEMTPDYQASTAVHGFHDMQHRTIWCSSSATEQAIQNHEGQWTEIDKDLKEFGKATVTRTGTQYLVKEVDGKSQSRYGSPNVSNWIRTVYQEGRIDTLFGFPEISNGRTLSAYGIPAGGGSSPSVWHYIPPFSTQYVSLNTGYHGFKIPKHRIENLHRTVEAEGFDASRMIQESVPIDYNPFWNPYYGHPVPIAPESMNDSACGENLSVTFWIQTVSPPSIDTDGSRYTWGHLKDGTKVDHERIICFGREQTLFGKVFVQREPLAPPVIKKPLICPIGWRD